MLPICHESLLPEVVGTLVPSPCFRLGKVSQMNSHVTDDTTPWGPAQRRASVPSGPYSRLTPRGQEHFQRTFNSTCRNFFFCPLYRGSLVATISSPITVQSEKWLLEFLADRLRFLAWHGKLLHSLAVQAITNILQLASTQKSGERSIQDIHPMLNVQQDIRRRLWRLEQRLIYLERFLAGTLDIPSPTFLLYMADLFLVTDRFAHFLAHNSSMQ